MNNADRLKQMIVPHAERLAELSNVGIAFLVYNPGESARAALVATGCPAVAGVFALSCVDAAEKFGNAGATTKAWCLKLPGERQIKVFLIAGEGTALLTLNFIEGDGVRIDVEPQAGDLH